MKTQTEQEKLDELEQQEIVRQRELEIKAVEEKLGSQALAKACLDDQFDYALRIRTGEVIRFVGAKVLNSEWITVELRPMEEQPEHHRIAFKADRGMDIRIADIVWVMDAPEGS